MAAVDPDGRPFAISEAQASYWGLAELIAEVREDVRDVLVTPTARESGESVVASNGRP